MTVGELQARMSIAEFIEWQAYMAVEPLGERRADIHTAQILQQQIGLWKDKHSELPSLESLIADWWNENQPEPVAPMTLVEKFRLATGG